MKGLVTRVGAEISSVDYSARFARMSFADQVGLFHRIIVAEYWRTDALLLGRSFGAWVLLNALMDLADEFPGTVILLAAVLGSSGEGRVRFIAPRNGSFWRGAETRGKAPARRFAMIHAHDDEQCPSTLAIRLGRLWGVEVVSFPSGGHGLGARAWKLEVADVVDRIWQPEV